MKRYITLLIITLLTISCSDPAVNNPPEIKFKANGGVIQQLNFPTTIINEETSKVLTIQNVGKGALEITAITVDPADSPNFDISGLLDELPINIDPKSEKEFTLIYHPVVVGLHKLDLTITSNAGENKITIIGGDCRPKLEVTPEYLLFQNRTGTKTQEITLQNIGTAYIKLGNEENIVAKLHDNSSPKFKLGTLPAGGLELCPKGSTKCGTVPQSVTIPVSYTTDELVRETGSVTIYSNDENSPATVELEADIKSCIIELSAESFDFGNQSISLVDPTEQTLTLKNVGNSDCVFTKIAIGAGDSPFSVKAVPAIPYTIGRDQSFELRLEFLPTKLKTFNHKLVLVANDPTWSDGAKEIALTGSGDQFPVAVCNICKGEMVAGKWVPNSVCALDTLRVEPAVDNPVEPLSLITLDGSDSQNPSPNPITYKWEKITNPADESYPENYPENSTATLDAPNQDKSGYFADLAGNHVFRLTVTNAIGSDSCIATVNAKSYYRLHIEMIWDKKESDMDLHLKQPGTLDTYENWMSTLKTCQPFKCFWTGFPAYQMPQLDRDDFCTSGPENINIKEPAVTTGYGIGANLFGYSEEYADSSSYDCRGYSYGAQPTKTEATIKIFCDNVLMKTITKEFSTRDQFIHFADVDWNGDDAAPDQRCTVHEK